MRYDVIVVGAGPAGSTIAMLLARKGFDVLLLDREKFPRDKVCGGAISPRSLSALERIGLLARFTGLGFRRIRGVRVFAPGGEHVNCDAPDGTHYRNYGYTVLRDVFDDMLRSAAMDAGADFVGGTEVKGTTRREGQVMEVLTGEGKIEHSTQVVIGAEGARSVIARSMGMYDLDWENLGVANRVIYTLDGEMDDYVEFHYDRSLLPGYAWIFPLHDNMVNIGLGALSARLRRTGSDIFVLLKRFLNHNPVAKELLRGAKMERKTRGWVLPMGGRISRTAGDGILLIGDAAHHVNPLTGEGIEYAMEGAVIAADVLENALEVGDLSSARLSEYDRRWREVFTPDFEASIKIRRMMSHPLLMDILVSRARKKESLASSLAGIIANMMDKKEFASYLSWIRRMM